jgi:hypothetical protein
MSAAVSEEQPYQVQLPSRIPCRDGKKLAFT